MRAVSRSMLSSFTGVGVALPSTTRQMRGPLPRSSIAPTGTANATAVPAVEEALSSRTRATLPKASASACAGGAITA